MKLFFQKIGEGKPLIILHGLYGFSDNWVTVGRKLSEYFSVYLVDQRNHGRSPHHTEHNYTVMADDLYELVVTEKLDHVYLLGHSMGGKTAMLFAAMHPCMVAGLIVVDIGPGGYASIDTPSSLVLAQMNIMSALRAVDMKNCSTREEIDRELSVFIKDMDIRQFMMKNVHRNADNSFSWKFNLEVLSQGLPSVMGPVSLDKILAGGVLDSFPVLFIKGEHSDYITAGQEELIRQYFPGAQLKIIAGARHWVHAEQPGQFMKVVGEFLIPHAN